MIAPLSRRRLLALGAAGAASLAVACGRASRHVSSVTSVAPPSSPPPTTTATVTAPPAPATTDGPAAPARFVANGPATKPMVALTFHGSGDVGLTAQLLDAARRLAAPITVFAVGQWIEANPDVAGRIRADGHELANHTYTHPALGRLGRAEAAGEIVGCRDVLMRLTGSPGRWFRPSGLAEPTAVILEEAGPAGYPVVVGYDVDPLDYQDPGAEAIVARVTAGLHAGAIVSLHTGHAGTVDAFEPVVAAIRSRGLEPVTVSRLLEQP